MYYKILASQYLQDAQALKRHIKTLKAQHVDKDGDINEEFKYKISLLYGMYLDLIHTGKYLIRKCEVMGNHED